MKLKCLLFIIFLNSLIEYSIAVVKRSIHATIVDSGEINGGGGGGGGTKNPCKFKHEVYDCDPCPGGELTCEFPRPTSQECHKDCRLTCLCERGYVRNRYDACVKLRDCKHYPPLDPQCKDRRAVYDCTPCNGVPTCSDPYPGAAGDGLCPKHGVNCVMDCICKKPYVLDEDRGRCVRLRDCDVSSPYEHRDE